MFNRKDWSKNNPENLSTLKVGKHISSSFSMFTIYSFKSIEMYTEYPFPKRKKKKVIELIKDELVKKSRQNLFN